MSAENEIESRYVVACEDQVILFQILAKALEGASAARGRLIALFPESPYVPMWRADLTRDELTARRLRRLAEALARV